MGRGGCISCVYMTSARDQGCEYGNQFYVSFGLDDRYLILKGSMCYRVLQEPDPLVASLTRKPIAQAHRDTPTSTQ